MIYLLTHNIYNVFFFFFLYRIFQNYSATATSRNRRVQQRHQQHRPHFVGRVLGPFQDALLDTIDIITRPDDDEGGVDENIAPTTTTTAPSVTTTIPTVAPVIISISPSSAPSFLSSSSVPSDLGSHILSNVPSSDIAMEASSDVPSTMESNVPSRTPSDLPSTNPSASPSEAPITLFPSARPTVMASDRPSLSPTTVPSTIPTFIPSDVPSTMPTLLPSVIPTTVPSDVPSVMPSTIPSDAPSTLPSDTPSSIPSNVPSSIPSSTISSVPSEAPIGSSSDAPSVSSVSTATKFSEKDIEVFESTCTQFLYDYLPLVQPNTYSELDCSVVNQTATTNASLRRHLRLRRRRQLQDDAAVVPFRVKNVEMLVAVTGDAPGETNFAQVVSQTFTTFGTELQDSLSKTSTAFSDAENNVETPNVPTDETTEVTRTSSTEPALDWTILGSAMAGGVCLALIVSLLLVKSRNRRQNDIDMPPEATIEDAKSKSFSVSSVRDGSSFREYSLIKLVSIEASRSLQKNEEEDDCMVMPPTPLGIDTVPDSLMNSPEEIKSELSPGSEYFGQLGGCCQNALDRFDTFEGPSSIMLNENAEANPSILQDDFDRNSTYMTGMSSTAMMTNETATKIDQLSSSQSESSDLEGLRLVVSNTNTFSNAGSKVETEPPVVERFQAQVEEKRGFFSFRPTLFGKRRSAMRTAGADDSMEVEEDCCAVDNWTVRTNSILTPRKANTTNGNTSIKGQSGSF